MENEEANIELVVVVVFVFIIDDRGSGVGSMHANWSELIGIEKMRKKRRSYLRHFSLFCSIVTLFVCPQLFYHQ